MNKYMIVAMALVAIVVSVEAASFGPDMDEIFDSIEDMIKVITTSPVTENSDEDAFADRGDPIVKKCDCSGFNEAKFDEFCMDMEAVPVCCGICGYMHSRVAHTVQEEEAKKQKKKPNKQNKKQQQDSSILKQQQQKVKIAESQNRRR